MTIDEFTQLIETHGSEPERWPSELRSVCEDLLATSGEARKLVSDLRQLDAQLARLEVPEFPGLEARVLQQVLPPQTQHPDTALDSLLTRILNWLAPEDFFGRQFWRPAMAACLPLVFGIVLGNYFSFGVGNQIDELDYWEDELTMLSLTDYTENTF